MRCMIGNNPGGNTPALWRRNPGTGAADAVAFRKHDVTIPSKAPRASSSSSVWSAATAYTSNGGPNAIGGRDSEVPRR